jgi:serine/threonine protein kinase/Flp pilus assembly protein TadD
MPVAAHSAAEPEQRLQEAILLYLRSADSGQPLSQQELLTRYPDLAEELKSFFADQSHLDPLLAPLRTSAPAPTVLEPGPLGDFQIVREIGRGGMGLVYEAVQMSLGRRVALKVLPFAAAMDSRRLQRFKNEAQAAGQLHHTNIVPVFYVGCERGVHFYAMQYIEGCTLAILIGELRRQANREAEQEPRQPTPLSEIAVSFLSGQYAPVAVEPLPTVAYSARRPSPAPAASNGRKDEKSTRPVAAISTERSTDHPAFFRTVARLGIQAAEALEHAHLSGVVHRDIKPGNLMLDTSWNVWVTDFGLAQFQSQAGLTLTGDLVGTLRYMSPEQVLAKRVLIDQRTDIYSLGATLYELLTLEAIFTGRDRQELLRQIAFEEPRPLRRLNKAIPPELETIILKAVEKNPADRYSTAQELAEDLRRFLMNEPIQAKRPSPVQRLRKMARRHTGVTVTAGVAIAVGLLLGVAGLVLNNRMVRQEQIRTQDALNWAKQEKAVSQAVRDFLRDKLLSQADPRAQDNAEPNPTIRVLLDRAADGLSANGIEKQFPGQALVQAEMLRTVGEAYGAIGEYERAIIHLERACDLQTRELGSEHLDTLATTNSLATSHLEAGKAAEAARLFERVRDLRAEQLGPDHPETLVSLNNLMRCYYALGRHEEALGLRAEIVKQRKAKLGPDHPETLLSMNNLANSYAARGRFVDALDLHAETLRLRKSKLGDDHPDTLQSMNNVANCYDALDRKPEALKLHEETLRLRQFALGADHPDTLKSMNNVAKMYSSLGRNAEALKLYEETLALRKGKLHLSHPDTVMSLNALAWLLANSPDPKLRDPRRALELAKQAVELAPEDGDYWNTFGAAYYRVGDWKGAVQALAKSRELRKGGDPTDWFFLAMAHCRLGDKNQGRQWYERAVQRMRKENPEDEELRRFRTEAAELLQIEKK